MSIANLRSALPSPLYRPCVGIMLLNARDLVFIGKRIAEGGVEPSASAFSWQMPQGGIDRGETPLKAAKRELYEETGVKSAQLIAESQYWLSYDLPEAPHAKSWRGRYRGQAQRWFAFRFTGDESEINITAPGAGHKQEFIAWDWTEMALLPDLIIPFKRQVYEAVVEEFAHLTGG